VFCSLACAQQFPIVLSEFGSALNDRAELECFTSLTNYMTSTGLANDGRHAPIQSWFYWCVLPPASNQLPMQRDISQSAGGWSSLERRLPLCMRMSWAALSMAPVLFFFLLGDGQYAAL
jgi:hypothetical protein